MYSSEGGANFPLTPDDQFQLNYPQYCSFSAFNSLDIDLNLFLLLLQEKQTLLYFCIDYLEFELWGLYSLLWFSLFSCLRILQSKSIRSESDSEFSPWGSLSLSSSSSFKNENAERLSVLVWFENLCSKSLIYSLILLHPSFKLLIYTCIISICYSLKTKLTVSSVWTRINSRWSIIISRGIICAPWQQRVCADSVIDSWSSNFTHGLKLISFGALVGLVSLNSFIQNLNLAVLVMHHASILIFEILQSRS